MRRTKITLKQLETFLYKSADKLRSQMDASEYKKYIFGLLFLNRLSDMFDEKRAQLRKEYETPFAGPSSGDFRTPHKLWRHHVCPATRSVGSSLDRDS